MGSRSRQSAFQGRLIGAKIRARSARELAAKAIREADRAEAEAWSVRMEGYGGPSQPSPTIAQCLNGGMGWLEVECARCKTRASLPLDAIRRWAMTPSSCATRLAEFAKAANAPAGEGQSARPTRYLATSSSRLAGTSTSTAARLSCGCGSKV